MQEPTVRHERERETTRHDRERETPTARHKFAPTARSCTVVPRPSIVYINMYLVWDNGKDLVPASKTTGCRLKYNPKS